MRLPLANLEVFTAIARAGSLKGAADMLGIKPSTVSHQLRSLETQLGKALFVRTTRSLALTEAGRALLQGTGPGFDFLEKAVDNARTSGHAARGRLKIAMPDFVYLMLVGPALPSFCQQYPEIEVDISLTDALSDILGEEMHAGFRMGDRVDENMVAVRLSDPLPLVVACSPEYLKRNGIPEMPADLLQHHCIRYRFQSSGKIAQWRFMGNDGEYQVAVQGNLVVDTLPASIDLARRGQGFVYTFRALCQQDLDAGHLISLFDDHLPMAAGIHLYFPAEYRAMLPLQLLRDHLKTFTS